jgi:hypothetical protein
MIDLDVRWYLYFSAIQRFQIMLAELTGWISTTEVEESGILPHTTSIKLSSFTKHTFQNLSKEPYFL